MQYRETRIPTWLSVVCIYEDQISGEGLQGHFDTY